MGPVGALRVAVPEELAKLSPRSGHGRVWATVVSELSRRARVRLVPDAELRTPARRAVGRRTPKVIDDVWLLSGHAELPRAATTSAAAIVVQVHEAPWDDERRTPYLDPEFLEMTKALTAASVAGASHVITPSMSAAREVVGAYRVSPGLVTVAPHGVDAEVFSPELTGGRELVAAAAQGRSRPYVLFVGTVHPRKNLAGLRDAMTQLAGRGLPHALAIVAGPAPDRGDSETLLAAARAELPGARGRVAWLDAADDVALAVLMAGADALCLPSFGEGFGLPALEAMACGTPVVVSDRGSLPEVVGDAGVVCEPNPDALADALEGVLSDPAHAAELGAYGRELALQRPWSRTAGDWLLALRQAVTEGWSAAPPPKPRWW